MARALPLWLLALATAATAADPFAACTTVDDPTLRLACYDRAAGRTPALSAPLAPPAAPVPMIAPAPRAPVTEREFGAEAIPPTPVEKAAERKELKARIKGRFVEWKHNTRIELDNGQVWKVVGYDSGHDSTLAPDPVVTITRSALGGYWMAIDGTGRSLRVRRVR